MNQIIPLKLLGIVALIMVCTWVFSFYLFGGSTGLSKYTIDSSISEDDALTYTEDMYFRAKVHCENPDNWGYTIFGDRGVIKMLSWTDKEAKGLVACTWHYWDDNYETGYYDSFNDFFDTLTFKEKRCIFYYYNLVVSTTGKKIHVDQFDGTLGVREVKKSWLDSATDFVFHDIPDKLGEIGTLMTFGFEDEYGEARIDGNVRFILNIIFIPLYIIIFIGILPLLVMLVSALGTVLDAVIPF